MGKNKNKIIEKVLQSSFKESPDPVITKQWRMDLRRKINELDMEEEKLFIRYENQFWRIAWISFAASIIIFLSSIYFINKKTVSLKQTFTQQTYEYLTIGNELSL